MQLQRIRIHAAVLVGLLLLSGPLASIAVQPQPGPTLDLPRVMRYVSSSSAHRGQTCYGLVLADDNGVPRQVRALGDQDPRLCYQGRTRHSQIELMRSALEVAGSLAPEAREAEALTELLPQDRLAELVLPPVVITDAELASMQRFVIGVGLNYAEHRDEVGADGSEELLVFPKPVAPTGAYTPVRAGVQLGDMPVRPVLLLDYEVELGLVLLEDVDLRNPPPSYEAFINNVAFFTANDVSDREPIILDDKTGYTRGKSHPSYLPIGPWLVSGRHLRPRAGNEGEHRLELGLKVYEARPGDDVAVADIRQRVATDAMLRGPWEILLRIGEWFREGHVICMRDADGKPRFVHNADGVIPAGSILLTGTPGGTAIRKPGFLQRLTLFLRGGFSVEGARQTFIRDAEEAVAESDYLEAGDRVESWVQYLGRQRWSVAADAERTPYGINSTGPCSPASRPQRPAQP